MSIKKEKKIKVPSGLGNATPDKVLKGITFTSDSGIRQIGEYGGTGRAAYGTVSPISEEKIVVSGLGFKPTIVALYLVPHDLHAIAQNELICAEGGRRTENVCVYFYAETGLNGNVTAYCGFAKVSAYKVTITDDGFEVTSEDDYHKLNTAAVYNYVVGLDNNVAVLSSDGSYITDVNGVMITLTER